MLKRSTGSRLKWAGVVIMGCGLAIMVYRWAVYPCAAEDAVPGATAVLINHPGDKDSFFSVIGKAGSGTTALFDGLKRSHAAFLQADTGWAAGLWMVHQLGSGKYGYSVAVASPLPQAAAVAKSSAVISRYRGIAVFQLAESVWAAQYRNLWLGGTQPRLVEAMIGELKDGRRDWEASGNKGIQVVLSNLPAFFSGMVTGSVETALQRLAQSKQQLRLSAAGTDSLILRGSIAPWSSMGRTVHPSAVAEYLPGQLAWCRSEAIDSLPAQHPLYPYFSSWAGRHKVRAQLVIPGDYQDHQLLLLPVKKGDPSGTLSDFVAAYGQLAAFPYQMFEVQQVLGDDLLSPFVPGGFRNPYLVVLGEYVAFSPSRRAVELAMNARSLGLSLLQDEVFSRRIPLGRRQSLSAWWYCNHDQAAGIVRSSFLAHQEEVMEGWSRWESTTAAVYENGEFGLNSRPAARKSPSGPRVVWQLPVEDEVIAGPFLFEDGLLVQEKERGLVCRGLDGRARWAYPLTDTLVGAPEPLELGGEGRAGFAFAAGRRIHLVDWQGKPYPPYPLSLPAAAASLRVSPLEGKAVYGLWATGRDRRIYGFNQEGQYLPGWGPNHQVDSLAPFRVQHRQYNGKDYVAAVGEDNRLYLFDRLGRLKRAPLSLKARAVSPAFLRFDALQQRLAVGQADGYVQVFNLEGQTFRLSLMPNHRGKVQFRFEDIAGDARGDYLMWDTSSLRLFGYEGNGFREIQSWAVGAPLRSVHAGERQDETLLFGFSKVARRIWAFSMDGEVLPGYPVAADTPPALWLQDGRLLILCYYEGSLYLYEL